MQAKFHYYLQSPRRKISPVRLHIHYQGVIPISIGESVPTKHWSKKTERLKQSYRYAPQVNQYLDKIKDRAIKAFYDLKSEGIAINADTIKAQVFPEKKKVNKEVGVLSFLEAWEKYISQHESKRSKNTLKVYRTTLRNLKAFQEATGFNLEYQMINQNFLDEFENYLIHYREMGNRTISKNVDNVKTFMRWAKKKGFHNCIEYEELRVRYKQIKHIALSKEELKAWEEVKLTGQLDLCRDMFLFSCLTSLRISDLYQLENRHIVVKKGKTCVSLNSMVKTKDPLFFPIHKKGLEILAKWEDQHLSKCFPLPPQPIYNKLLKEVGKLAGINDVVEREYYIGPELMKELVPKYTLIKSHTARRTFVTHWVEDGKPMGHCRIFTGHGSNRELERYWNKSETHILNALSKGMYCSRTLPFGRKIKHLCDIF